MLRNVGVGNEPQPQVTALLAPSPAHLETVSNRVSPGHDRGAAMDPIKPDTYLLFTVSQQDLDSLQLSAQNRSANLRRQLSEIIAQLVDLEGQAALIHWLRNINRDSLRKAIEGHEDALSWARRQHRERGRTVQELIPLPQLTEEERKEPHRRAALTYQARNLAEGKCEKCPQPREGNKRLCTDHLRQQRERYTPKIGRYKV